MKGRSEWLTGVRIQRLADVLIAIPSIPSNISSREAERLLWRRCGGPVGEISDLIVVLLDLKLIRADGDSYRRTLAGDQLTRALRAKDQRVLSLTLIRSGRFYDQARLLIECGEIDVEGRLRCPSRLARTGAPQLLGLMQSWQGVQIHPDVIIPKEAVTQITNVWALLPPPVELPKWAAERKAVGNRAEMYTVQLERNRADPSKVVWVARDSDTFGYDVEDRSENPTRCIEVKGSQEIEPVFFISENEYSKAQELGAQYEVHFWGGINLSVEPSLEYTLLTTNGFPIIIKNLSTALGTAWKPTPVKWRIERIP
jgi:hypothetical protein